MNAHDRALERLYAAAPVQALFPSVLAIEGEGRSRTDVVIEPRHFHGGGAAPGAVCFKLLDDAAFFAAASLVADVFVLTTQFAVALARPRPAGPVTAHGHWTSGRRRTLFAEARLVDALGVEVARGSGVFMRSRVALADLAGYA